MELYDLLLVWVIKTSQGYWLLSPRAPAPSHSQGAPSARAQCLSDPVLPHPGPWRRRAGAARATFGAGLGGR